MSSLPNLDRYLDDAARKRYLLKVHASSALYHASVGNVAAAGFHAKRAASLVSAGVTP